MTHWTAQLEAACAAANREAVAVARLLGDPPEPPSCTFVAAVTDGDLIVAAWCGDSRAYWLGDDGASEQLSRRSLARHADDRRRAHPGRGRGRSDVAHDHPLARRRQRRPDARVPVAAGVPGRVGWSSAATACGTTSARPPTLAALVASAPDASPPTVAAHLVEHALAGGGQDNITATVARLETPPSQADPVRCQREDLHGRLHRQCLPERVPVRRGHRRARRGVGDVLGGRHRRDRKHRRRRDADHRHVRLDGHAIGQDQSGATGGQGGRRRDRRRHLVRRRVGEHLGDDVLSAAPADGPHGLHGPGGGEGGDRRAAAARVDGDRHVAAERQRAVRHGAGDAASRHPPHRRQDRG